LACGSRGDPNSVPTYSIFATFPAKYLGNWVGPFVDQVVGTAFLLAFIFALTDERNQPPRANLAPLIAGFVVVAIGISFGANAGYAINPARDFGPRLFAAIAGWDKVALPGDYGNVNTCFWIPIIGPFLGGPDRSSDLRLDDPRHAVLPRQAGDPGRRGARAHGRGLRVEQRADFAARTAPSAIGTGRYAEKEACRLRDL
jgi:major intrinsic protein